MESSSTHLSDDTERILEENLSDSESSLFGLGDSSAIEDLSTHEASDSDDSAGNSTSPLQGRASDTSFMWVDMSKVKIYIIYIHFSV
jgi:hypothetical protein